jgi:hypothetical protein
MASPDEYWQNLDTLSGRRIVRQQVSQRDYAFLDSAGATLGSATRRSRSWESMGSTMTTADGAFRTVGQRLRVYDFGFRSWFALERVSERSQPQTLMMSGDRSRRFRFDRVSHCDDKPFGTINMWSLPDGTPLDAHCLGRQKPFHVLLLKSNGKALVSLRYLVPRQPIRSWIGSRSNKFRLGEAILDDGIPEANDQILPLLMFAFEVLQAINTVPGGGG